MMRMELKTEKKQKERKRDLVDHSVLEDGGSGEDFHGDGITGIHVASELDLGEGAFTNGPANLVLAHLLHLLISYIHHQDHDHLHS